jgi:hypothetical protein
MTKEEKINGSKLIAEFLGWKYIPFNDLQDFPKAGWWKCIPKVQDTQKSTVYSLSLDSEKEKIKEVDLIRYNIKNGWKVVGEEYCKYICRTHEDLRFWNDWNTLIPVIEKIEEETGRSFYLGDGGCCSGYGLGENMVGEIDSYENKLTWLQNTFNTVVKTLENGK